MNTRRVAPVAALVSLTLVLLLLRSASTYAVTLADCTRTEVGFTALPDLRVGLYRGYEGGLYPEGAERPPEEYARLGSTYAGLVEPLDANGKPNSTGKLVLLSIGMSNTTQEFSEFKRQADLDPQKNPKLVIVDGAQGGQDAEIIKDPNAPFWGVVDTRLGSAGVNNKQVQAVWLKEAIAGENRPFPADAQRLQEDLRAIIEIMQSRYPNLQLVYLSSRTYAGYASSNLNPEPYAYESGFAIKWLIQDRINLRYEVPQPWLAWGPYLWTDGAKGRNDGLLWRCEDTQSDGTHPSATGRQKVAALLLNFFKTEPTAVGWFLQF